jgi:hypothetical protein
MQARTTLLLLAVLLLAGCTGREHVLTRKPAASVALVCVGVCHHLRLAPALDSVVRAPDLSIPVPPRVLPKSYRGLFATAGGRWRVVVALASDVRLPPVVLVFDARWHLVGRVSGLRLPNARHNWYWEAKWDPDHRWLALDLGVEHEHYWILGFVHPPSLAFMEVSRAGVGYGAGFGLTWAAGRLIWVGGASDEIMAADPTTRAVSSVYRDPVLSTPICRLLPSPDGRFIAFDRTAGKTLGIWVLDLVTRKAGEVTYEMATLYDHNLVRWEDDSDILFARPRHDDTRETYDIYRAHLARPGKSTKPRPVTHSRDTPGERGYVSLPRQPPANAASD